MLYSPHAHAKIKKLDTSKAEDDAGRQGGRRDRQGEGSTLRYQGDDIAAVAAETEEQARDAVRAIKVEYEVLPHVVTEEQAMAEGAPRSSRGATSARAAPRTTGKPDEAMAKADVVDRGHVLACRSSPTSAWRPTA